MERKALISTSSSKYVLVMHERAHWGNLSNTIDDSGFRIHENVPYEMEVGIQYRVAFVLVLY